MKEFILRKNDLINKYDLHPLDKFDFMKEVAKCSNLLKLIKLVTLSTNKSFSDTKKEEMKYILYFILIKNIATFSMLQIFCFVISYFWNDFDTVRYYMDYTYYNNLKFVIYRFIFFYFPELFVFFGIRITNLYFRNKSILNKMRLVNERYQYIFNNTPNNNIICKEIKTNFDLYFIIKTNKNQNNFYISYKNDISLLQDKFFYEYVIIYSTESFAYFFNKLCSGEELALLFNIKKSFSENNLIIEKYLRNKIPHKYYIRFINILMNLYSMKNCSLLLLIIKISIFILDFLLDLILVERKELIGLKRWKKIINNEILNKGYFLDLNNDIIAVYKIKDEYASLKSDYQYFCKESTKLMNL